jgi:hypothetical protein
VDLEMQANQPAECRHGSAIVVAVPQATITGWALLTRNTKHLLAAGCRSSRSSGHRASSRKRSQPPTTSELCRPRKKDAESERARPAGCGPATPSLAGWQCYMDPAHFVFLDETAATTAMMRLYGLGPRSERLVDPAPYGH